jgi:hypothetical protein
VINIDGLNNAPAQAVAVTSFKLVDAMQGEQPHMQVAAAGALFLAICDRYQIEPHRVATVIRNMFEDRRYVAGNAEHFRAIRDYVKHELK